MDNKRKKPRYTVSNLGKNGRLGNQLYQIASAIGFAEKNGAVCFFPPWEYNRYFCNAVHSVKNDPAKYLKVNEPSFHYNEITLDASANIDFNGYYQSERYFDHVIPKIKKLFTFNQSWLHELREKYISSFEGKKTCAVHVRRGDYIGNPNYYNLGINYYVKAMMEIGWTEFIVFSDDIDWCKKHMPDWCHFIHADSDIEDMALISLCDHFIISNSTFSWWAAWIGEKQHSKVISSDRWFAGAYRYKLNAKDIIPDRWMKLSTSIPIEKGTRYNLKDVTFTIPIRIDHQDRIDNLKLILGFLNYHFETNIIVMEQDQVRKLPELDGCQYHFISNRIPEFERTHLLNEMAKMATTSIIANYDCDVVFMPTQILEAVDKIRKGIADGVSPYDGMFLRAWRTKLVEFAAEFEVDQLNLGASREEHFLHHAVGGAIFWSKEKFISGGMENEYMVSYGPEDYERVERFKKLGFKLDRVDGPLIHINHWIGSDSTANNPYFRKNWDEHYKIQGMNRAQLADYVATWPWCNLNEKK